MENKTVKNRFLVENKKGQVTIFIILALALVVVLVVLLYPNINVLVTGGTPVQQLESCLSEPVEEALPLVLSQGGYVEPENYQQYNENKVAYLCYTEEKLKRCSLQEAFIKNKAESEIKKYAENEIKNCLNSARQKLQGKGYTVKMDEPVVNISIIPQGVLAEAKINLVLTKSSTESYEIISSLTNSRIYSLAIISNEILKQEVKYGDSEIMNFISAYPGTKIEKNRLSDGTNIYTLTSRATNEKFMFATKNLVWPGGYGAEEFME